MENIILDTNILLSNPSILLEYDNVVIPYVVLRELDKKKNDKQLGYFAREATRLIIDYDNIKCREILKGSYDYADDALIDISLMDTYKVVTQDYLLYLKAKAKNGNVSLFQKKSGDIYTGVTHLQLPSKKVNELYNEKQVDTNLDLYENQFVKCGSEIARYKGGKLWHVRRNKSLSGLERLNERQVMGTELLFDRDVTVIGLWGKAGTGKTALAIKSAMQMLNHEYYSDVLISRPMVQNGSKEERLGTLPGNKDEKHAPFVAPFEDNLKSFQMKIGPSIQPLTTIQGRSISDTFYIVDEAQDIEPDRIIQLIERIGKGSKIIFTGDPRQINKKWLNRYHNGISFLCNSLKGQPLFGCVNLIKNERSETAKLGDIMRDKLHRGN